MRDSPLLVLGESEAKPNRKPPCTLPTIAEPEGKLAEPEGKLANCYCYC